MIRRFVIPAAFATALLASPGAMAVPEGMDPINDFKIDPVAAAIRTVLADAGKHGAFLDKRDAAAVAQFYAENGYAPIWTTDGALTERGLTVAKKLRGADADGLNPRDYPTPPATGYYGLRHLARAEVMLSRSAVTYARHAYSGRLTPRKLSSNLDYEPHAVESTAVLPAMVAAADPAEVLDSYNPDHEEFQILRTRLAEIRSSEAERPPYVPEGRYLKLGSKSDRVAILRERLKLTDEVEDPRVFGEALDEAVRSFQETAGIKVDGIVGPGTLGVLNRAAVDHEATILVNMERWRWMPKTLGNLYVRVNVPNFNLEIRRSGEVYHQTRIVVGKPKHATPIFSDEIEHVVVNPTWNVPASIARNELLPAAIRNRGSLRGYNVYANINGRFRRVDPTFVNWSSVDMRKIQIKQPPGARNALGQVKFMFPNKHAVYLHDTPAKSLFKKDYRAYSHGCMRVHNPWDFADALLDADPSLSGQLVKKMVGGREQQLNLEEHIPVHVTYFTAWVDSDGELQIRGDLYGHDKRMKKALGLS